MIFCVYRTNSFLDNPQPCPTAYKEGENWYIKIDTLEELLDFRREIDEELVFNLNTIEIYDDYRE